MENNKKHTVRSVLTVFVILAVAGTGAYFLIQKLNSLSATPVSKSDMVVEILSQSGGAGDYNGLMGLANAYISSWYAAVKAKSPTFVSGSSTFDTVTGKQVS